MSQFVLNIGLVIALSTLNRKCVKQKSERIFVAFTAKGKKDGVDVRTASRLQLQVLCSP